MAADGQSHDSPGHHGNVSECGVLWAEGDAREASMESTAISGCLQLRSGCAVGLYV